MTSAALSDVVSNQYTRWVYPEPIVDLPDWLSRNWQWFDPTHANRIFWPDQDYRPGLDILIAGCGTNQAAVIAYTNPEARVVAVDVSSHSLEHERFLKQKYHLTNLDLHLLPIEEVVALDKQFDLIISTGVLHHLASPITGLAALTQCLRRDGVIALMLYAKYSRIGVDMLQSVFRDLGLGQDETSIRKVREVLTLLPSDHPVRAYMSIAPDLGYDAGLVDTFLHGRERTYSIPECLALVEDSGLVFQDLFFKAPYHPSPFARGPLPEDLALVSREQRWSVMERLNHRNGCHFFTACRPDRPVQSYTIDLSTDESIHYAPMLRHRCSVSGSQISRHNWSMELSPSHSAMASLIDGHRSIHDIAEQIALSGALEIRDPGATLSVTHAFFKGLWELDFVTMGLPR